ncbi:hypothetical protein [Denitrobaculum tricleocarpae]|uniref:Uncharacterized protein n=1 Tax=Denitrobaculum tricleocarpae TaxID=2591009 RepID=A0A545TB77_9PROT|nr:hypothetical protein [Denitrobaculum tricleocarpae]TQV74456.1 hypothetical protein FKG95_24575 [Denitrobaculum tricleocarpae]
MEWRTARHCTTFKWAFVSPLNYAKSRHAALKNNFGVDSFMNLILHFLFYEVLWFFIDLLFAVDRAAKAEKDFVKVKEKVAALIRGREHELSNLSQEIVEVFRRHRFKIIERSDDEIVFRHRFKDSERVTMRLR